ncbi:MAG: hypothetical protein ACREX0_00845, partial [Noviherbaspirillum sp.]
MSPLRHPGRRSRKHLALRMGALGIAFALSACATMNEPEGAPRKEVIYAVTASNQLVSFNAGQPRKLVSQKPLTG